MIEPARRGDLPRPTVAVIDNYDSFAHNLARYIRLLGFPTWVVRNDQIAVDDLARARPRAIVLSPGPCTPKEAGICLEVVRRLSGRVPLLGVCLGHQVIVEALGGRIVRAPRPVHGRASWIRHTGEGLFDGLASPLAAGRYHSLIADRATLPSELNLLAEDDDGLVMAVQHHVHPTAGVQFHPESVLTPQGDRILANFFARWVGDPASSNR